jgi:hypothetical protein
MFPGILIASKIFEEERKAREKLSFLSLPMCM